MPCQGRVWINRRNRTRVSPQGRASARSSRVSGRRRAGAPGAPAEDRRAACSPPRPLAATTACATLTHRSDRLPPSEAALRSLGNVYGVSDSDTFGARSTLEVGGESYEIFRLDALQDEVRRRAPAVLAEGPAREPAPQRRGRGRRGASPSGSAKDEPSQEIAYTPARVLMQDFTGVPAIVDLAAMRDAMEDLGGDADQDQPAGAGRARDRPLDPGGRVRRAARLPAQRRARVRAQPRALRVPALGPGRRSTTSRWCRPTPASATR